MKKEMVLLFFVLHLPYLLGELALEVALVVNPTISFIEFRTLMPALLFFSRGLARSTAVLKTLSHEVQVKT